MFVVNLSFWGSIRRGCMKKFVRERKENFLYDVFVRGIEVVVVEEFWRSIWMWKGYLKKEMEGMICVV